MANGLDVNQQLLAEISAQLKLRPPNAQALETIVASVSEHFDDRQLAPPFEGVVSSATGVGKTYVMASTIDYFAQHKGWTHFVVVVPGSTIREKTLDNFTPGAAKSLTAALGVRTELITAENFDTPHMAAIIADPEVVKIYVLTVQVLLRPETAGSRRAHRFMEGLGGELYSFLQQQDDLVVLADEHHLYYGPKFSAAVRGLNPLVLIGLTATPHRNTPEDQIIFKYPLAAAIGEKFVKTPVIVGRRDDRHDLLTQLIDGTTLLEYKRKAVAQYRQDHPKAPDVNPVMLVLARDTSEADEIASVLRSPDFKEGAYAEAVIQVDSSVTDREEPAMWERLSNVEEPSSPIRIVVSVRMLKEGWDVKNVYVLHSTQPSLSDVLTEQVLGRGLRLPFGEYTGIQMLDTLEVLAHDRFRQLLERANVLSEEFISFRTRAVLQENSSGDLVSVREQEEVGTHPVTIEPVEPDSPTQDSDVIESPGTPGTIQVASVEGRAQMGEATSALLGSALVQPIPNAPALTFPVLRPTQVQASFSLRDITDVSPFRDLGRRLRVDPQGELQRTAISARRQTGSDGIERMVLVRTTAQDRVRAESATSYSLEDIREQLRTAILSAPAVSARRSERSVESQAADPLLDAFFEGVNGNAETLLSAYLDRAAALLLQLVNDEQRQRSSQAVVQEVATGRRFNPSRRNTRSNESEDRLGPFDRNTAYKGWNRSIMPLDWFDSAPEREFANVVDDDESVRWWIRLQRDELPLTWTSAGEKYNPDFIVIGTDNHHWLIEVKADRDLTNSTVLAKREAAKRWANYVNTSPEFNGQHWKYLLISESDLTHANGSWPQLRGLAGT
ncbi:DEAD/DEAH box helicase family protein [Arthrobacter sp. VKM Ac-2550]|uniref:DEAD/DEAH box helicase family protein n=1 Tax=Crystallibacter permensis TaxID=1938888 RepID=UPI002227F1B3|nr:DEAD/DEAH box helicase family protein [Arthrobacter sp. VKM Ac-2550]MCW2133380.1 type III restriction enzyme [Arthrobacter sp. VKM Ac-2550]